MSTDNASAAPSRDLTLAHVIGILIVRIGAAWLTISGLTNLLWLLPSLGIGLDYDRVNLSSAVFDAFWVGLGLVFWIFAPAAVAKLAPKLLAEAAVRPADMFDYVAIGSFLIGAFHLVEHVPPTAVRTAAVLFDAFQRRARYDDVPPSIDFTGLASNWLVCAVALFLTLRPTDLAKLFVWLRRA